MTRLAKGTSLGPLFGAMGREGAERTRKVEALIVKAFSRPRDPRSIEYRCGCRALLDFKLGGEKPRCPFTVGTASADAWFAGLDEGWSIYKDSQRVGPDHQP